MKICVVGAGTAGLIAALTLKNRFKNFNIQIIKSDKVGIVGVGEGSTEHWKQFCNYNKISIYELIKETDATFKYGIMFKDWKKQPYFHSILGNISNVLLGQYQAGYAYCINNNLKPKEYTHSFHWDNKISNKDLPNQFHFNTLKLNKFLLKKCKEISIEIIDDEITKINLNEKNIDSIESSFKKYKSDFYIDCTGFKKLLISKLGAKWVSYKKYLPMNEAIAFATEDTEEYPPFTISKAMAAGWMWRIPTQGRWGNGYVFNNKYINAKQAQKECEKYLGHSIKVTKNITFEAGSLDRAWIGNCVAVGLSSNFIEPLEASSIGISIQQSFLLMHLITNYHKNDVNLYNKKFTDIIENTRDFVLLHYLCGKKGSNFWDEFKPNLPESLSKNLETWKHRLPLDEDFNGLYLLFKPENFIIILKELNLLNKKNIKKEFNSLSNNHKNWVLDSMKTAIKNNNYKSNYHNHKDFLKNLITSNETDILY
jgi:tryptophan halogenase